MEFSCRCHLTTGGITSSTLLPFGLWAPDDTDEPICDGSDDEFDTDDADQEM